MNKRVLLLQQRQWGVGIGHEIAKRFQRDGWRLAAFTAKKTTHEFTIAQSDVTYDLVMSHDEIKESSRQENVTLEEICADLGEDTIWPFVYAVRNDVYNYRDKYYYSFRQNRSDEEIVNYVKGVYTSIKRAMDSFEPEYVVMPNSVSMFQIFVALVARQRGIKAISFSDSKVRGIYLVFCSPYLDSGPFIDRVRQLNDGAESSNWKLAAEYVISFRASFIQPDYAEEDSVLPRGVAQVKHELVPYLESIYFLLGRGRANRVKSQGVTIDYRPPRIILRDHYAAKRYRKAALSRSYTALETLGRFVYLPLQVQPEAQIDMLATHFANQIETARQIALSLPGDHTLAVKEHPSMIARRPPSYHEKLARLPNVKLLDPRVPTPEILKSCSLVISPGGTTLAEAAFYRKPAIQLGRMGTSLMLPNVIRHTDMTTLSGAIRRELARSDLETEEYERRLQNYIAAAYDTGLAIDLGRVWYEGGSEQEYDAIYHKIHETI